MSVPAAPEIKLVPAVERQLAELSARLPGWHVWYIVLSNGPRGRVCWCAKPEGAGKAAISAYGPVSLVRRARDFTIGIAVHIARTRRLVSACEEWNTQVLASLQADLAAFEKLAAASESR